MAEAVFRCFFPGRVRLFGKTNGHSRESRATNATGKNDLLRGQNKAERNCRHAQGTQQIKSRSCRTVFLCGSFCFSVLICTPNTGCPVLGVHIIFAYFSVCTQNSISGAFDLFSDHAFQFLCDRCTVCNTVIPEIRNTFALFHGQIAVDQKQAFWCHVQLFAQRSIFSIINASTGGFGFYPEKFPLMEKTTSSSCVFPADAVSERTTLEQTETSAPCSSR